MSAAENANWETECPKREDKQHCNCWYDGEACCACGDNAVGEPLPQPSPPPTITTCKNCGGDIREVWVHVQPGFNCFTPEPSPPSAAADVQKWRNALRNLLDATTGGGYWREWAERALMEEEPHSSPPSPLEHLAHVQRFLLEMYQTMVDPVEEFDGNIEQLCALLLNRAREDREALNSRVAPQPAPNADEKKP